MKKWIILLAAVAVVVIAWYFGRQYALVPFWAQPKFGQVTRGDIKVPITAAGLIHPHQVIEVKSMASGRIMDVSVVEGDFATASKPLVVLDPIDEQRALDRAQADHDRAEAMLTQARVAVDRAQVAIESAQTNLAEAVAQGEIVAFQKQKDEDLAKAGNVSAQDLVNSRAQYQINLAHQEAARIAIRSAAFSKQDAEAAVRSQVAIVEAARKTKEDHEKSLRETTVLAPGDAIVTEVWVRPGMLVQSATTGFTGGTPLMKLADVSRKKVIARLDEADYGRVLNISPLDALPAMPELRAAAEQDAAQLEKRGGLVRITVDAFPEQVFEGRIERVEPQGRLNAGSSIIQFDVHVEITDPKRHLLPLGAQAQVEFTVECELNALQVPAEAVKTFEEQRGVWIKTQPEPGSQEQFGKRFVPCRFGINDGEHTQVVEVLAGNELKEGTEVYTKLPPKPGEAD
jgi:multidrug efflux pump subunit AcrA (membrane-fusion protein)